MQAVELAGFTNTTASWSGKAKAWSWRREERRPEVAYAVHPRDLDEACVRVDGRVKPVHDDLRLSPRPNDATAHAQQDSRGTNPIMTERLRFLIESSLGDDR
jgi:hypothetical protein